jgi:hypothetical protein
MCFAHLLARVAFLRIRKATYREKAEYVNLPPAKGWAWALPRPQYKNPEKRS